MRLGGARAVGARPLFFALSCNNVILREPWRPKDLHRTKQILRCAQNDNTIRTMTFSYELTCRQCGWRTVCGREDALARLRIIGQLRREREPEENLVEA